MSSEQYCCRAGDLAWSSEEYLPADPAVLDRRIYTKNACKMYNGRQYAHQFLYFIKEEQVKRTLNFNAGPTALPLEVLQQLNEQLIDYQGEGLSMIESSHRSASYDALHQETLSLVRELLQVPDDYSIFFLGGGATLQFGMVPMNFLPANGSADYVRSGAWSDKACDDAKKVGNIRIVFDGEDTKFSKLPDAASCRPSENAAYYYLCSNETIGGIQWHEWPDTGNVPLIADMSSDILSRPLPIEKFSLIFAGTQKNIGPAGATLVIIRNDLAEKSNPQLPSYLSYQVHSKKDGLLNTPPVFTIWAVKLMLEWMKKNGGAEGMQRLAEKKAGMLYDVIDQSSGFYHAPAAEENRSLMNVVFRLPSEELEKQFLAEAQQEQGMIGLKGHRSVGGCRASIYNGVPVESVEALAEFMKEFAGKHG